jgi:hypothetical protein
LQPFDLCVSQIVVDESAAGDSQAATRRLGYIDGLPLLDLTSDADQLAGSILESRVLPSTAVRDVTHIAVATVHEVDILLTWNCRHIANAAIIKELASIAEGYSYDLPVLCTPFELLGDQT